MNAGGGVNQRRQCSGRPCSTYAPSCLDVGEPNAHGLELVEVDTASLQAGEVTALSLRVRALHERRLALVLGLGYTSDAERQRQSGQDDVPEESSHA